MSFGRSYISKSLLLLGILGLIVFLVGLAGFLVDFVLAPVKVREPVPVEVSIPPNASTGQIAEILGEQDLIRHPWVFRLYARYKGLDGRLQAGEYELSADLSTPEIIQRLVRGRVKLVSFTIPEGLTLSQVTNLLTKRGLVDQQTFKRLLDEVAAAHPLFQDLAPEQRSLEGYLFPDTYLVSPKDDAEEIIQLMLARFEEEVAQLDLVTRARKRGLTLHEAVTLASLIERETRVAKERSVISGVIYNRLDQGMLLQVDATVIYALGDFNREVVLNTDLEVDSPYNTYRHPGIPPGPIASPGRASLVAAVGPDKHDYLYYVAKPDGSHAFSRTLAEHNRNRNQYLP